MVVALSVVLALLPHIVFLIAKLLGWAFSFNVSYKWFGITALGLVVLCVGAVFYGYYIGRFFYEKKNIDLHFTTLPDAFNDYRIVQISDLHLSGWQEKEDKLSEIVQQINDENADLIVFTGDIVGTSDDDILPFTNILSALKAKDGIISILGNHDYLPYNAKFGKEERLRRIQNIITLEQQMGWQVLLNDNIKITRSTDSIAILGSENQSLGVHNIIMRGDLQKTMATTDSLFRILLTHDPTHWRAEVLQKTNIPLTLSGHTHGGQAKLFGHYASELAYKEQAGLYCENNQYLYVNVGLGATVPFRINVPAEITIFRLKKKQ